MNKTENPFDSWHQTCAEIRIHLRILEKINFEKTKVQSRKIMVFTKIKYLQIVRTYSDTSDRENRIS